MTGLARRASCYSPLLALVSCGFAIAETLKCDGEERYLARTQESTAEALAGYGNPIVDGAGVSELCLDLHSYKNCNEQTIASIRGIKIRAAVEEGEPARGVALIAQGNGMPARVMQDAFRAYMEAGLDVYIYDYRGHGESSGEPSLGGMVEDYSFLIDSLRASRHYRNRPIIVHGISHGGIILANALNTLDKNLFLVFDGVPSRVPSYRLFFLFTLFRCPETFDPINRINAIASADTFGNLIVLVGDKDKLIKPHQSRELLDLVREHSRISGQYRELSHPFSRNDGFAERHSVYKEIAAYVFGGT